MTFQAVADSGQSLWPLL